jgi:hypothetical protein
MQLSGQILTGSTQTIATKKGDHLQKTRLKVLDLGPEANGGDVYWIDFVNAAAFVTQIAGGKWLIVTFAEVQLYWFGMLFARMSPEVEVTCACVDVASGVCSSLHRRANSIKWTSTTGRSSSGFA